MQDIRLKIIQVYYEICIVLVFIFKFILRTVYCPLLDPLSFKEGGKKGKIIENSTLKMESSLFCYKI
jgi:hypothetical protein